MNYKSALQFNVALLTLLSLLSFSSAAQSQVVINELMPSNQSTISDQDGAFSDWIEIYNPSDQTIDITGYGISDDPEDPFQWTIPELVLEAGEYYLLFASDKEKTGSEVYWETVVREGDDTNYLIPDAPVDASWIQPGFDDSGWETGPFGIGYGDGDDNTETQDGIISIFTRTYFTVEDVSKVADMIFHVDYDDGYIAYLNGTEIARANMNGEGPRPYNEVTTTYVGDPLLINGQDPIEVPLNDFTHLLEDGENVLSIQVHNTSATSSDMSLIPFLSLGYIVLPEETRGVAAATNLPDSDVNYPHLNFKLSSDGEKIVLTDSTGTTVDEITYPELNADESYGRLENDISSWVIFPDPTPLESNGTDGFAERLIIPELTKAGGFQSSVHSVGFKDTTVSNVYYTTDGTIPDENSALFEPPVTFNQTTILRLRAIEAGGLSSDVQTHTYFVGVSHDLPVISLVTEPGLLWSDEQGIYVVGENGALGNCIEQIGYENANWNQDWEIPANIELYKTDKSLGFNSPVGTKVFGGCSRLSDQKSLSVFFRGEYGNAELEYQLFEEKDIDAFQSFVLRNSGNDFGYTHIRDAMMKTLIEDDTEIDYQAYQPVVVYLNGEYWGIHNIREKINEHFIASNHDVNPDEIDLIENNGFIKHGEGEAYSEFWQLLNEANPSNQEEYEALLEYIDLDNYVDYSAAQIFFANQDWPGNNLRYWRERKEGAQFRWIMYDTDFGFNMYGQTPPNLDMFPFVTATSGPEWPNPPWSTLMFRKLLQNNSFERALINRFADLLNTVFQPSNITATIDSLVGNIESEMPAHQSRFNRNMGGWENNLNQIRDFGERRVGFMEDHIQNFFGVSGPSPITVDIAGEGGVVKVNRVIPKAYPWTGAYFGDVPVEITAIPKPGFTFTGWSGDGSSSERVLEVIPEEEPNLTANFEKLSMDESNLVINEIMYNAPDDEDPQDWIEFYNPNESALNISGWMVKDEDDDHEFMFPDNTVIAADGYLVVTQSIAGFNAIYENVEVVVGEMDFGLGGGGDQVRLYNAAGALVDSVEYDDGDPWPTEADGNGYSLELKEVTLDNTLAENWSASVQYLGTPGTENGIITSADTEQEIPNSIALNQNYPNPFNPSTVISYQLAENSRVSLEVFDMLGRKVASLIHSERMAAGVHQVTFQADNLASGIYIYRLKVNDEMFTKKMLLLK